MTERDHDPDPFGPGKSPGVGSNQNENLSVTEAKGVSRTSQVLNGDISSPGPPPEIDNGKAPLETDVRTQQHEA